MSGDFRKNAWRGVVIVAAVVLPLVVYSVFEERPFGIPLPGWSHPEQWAGTLFIIALFYSVAFQITGER